MRNHIPRTTVDAALEARRRAQQARRWGKVVNVLAFVALLCAVVVLIGALAACDPEGDSKGRPLPTPQPNWQVFSG